MFFDLSLPDIVMLLGLGVMLFGPEKLPQAAATAARFIRQVRAFSESTRTDLRRELGPEFDGLNLQDLNPKTFISKNLLGESEDLRAMRAQINEGLRIPAGSQTGSLAVAERTVLAVGERPLFDEEAT
jgi:sec-independent protein translocase protein TatB